MNGTDSLSGASLLDGLQVLDAVGLLVVGLLVVLGLARGLWWQVVRLLGVGVAVAVARTWDQDLGGAISDRWPELSPRLALGIAWASLFVAGLSVAAVFGRMGSSVLEAMRLGLVNRVAGGLVGGATGVLLHLALVIALCQLAPGDFLAGHVTGTWSGRLLDALAVERPIVLAAESSDDLGAAIQRAVDAVLPEASGRDRSPADDSPVEAPPTDDRPRVR